jgi:hypothetical protein
MDITDETKGAAAIKPQEKPEARGNVLQFPDRDMRRQASAAKGRTDLSFLRKEVSKEQVIEYLKEVEGFTPELEKMLDIPRKLYMLDEIGVRSFSSDSSKGVESITNAYRLGLPQPDEKDLPEYGIAITIQGTNSVCAFVDKRRGIKMTAELGGMFSKVSWSEFIDALAQAA